MKFMLNIPGMYILQLSIVKGNPLCWLAQLVTKMCDIIPRYLLDIIEIIISIDINIHIIKDVYYLQLHYTSTHSVRHGYLLLLYN